MQLTQEQKNIVDVFRKGENIVINAFAWSWKTSILKILAEDNLEKKFLVFCFNKKNADELNAKMPSNVTATTMHSFALKFVRQKYWKRKIENNNNKLIEQIKDFFGVNMEIATFFQEIFEIYCNNSWWINSKTIINILNSQDHLYDTFRENEDVNFSFKYLVNILLKIKKNIEDGSFCMTHSFYLKYFQLNFEDFFSKITKYDVVMLDEWQDSNPVFLDFFYKLSGQKIVVGDKHQAIYGRRYAINAMDLFDYNKLYSSFSFRFVPKIAQQANHILKHYKNENKELKSFFTKKELICDQKEKKVGVIFRSNSGILRYINDLDDDQEICFLRNLNEIFSIFLKIDAVKNYYEWKFDYISDNYFRMFAKNFRSWDLFKDFFLQSNRIDIISAIKIVERFNVYYLKKKAEKLQNINAKMILTTAHTSKWSEFDETIISDDFSSFIDSFEKKAKEENLETKDLLNMYYNTKYDHKKIILSLKEEINLIYVSLTRAKIKNNILSNNIQTLLDKSRYDFEKLVQH